MRHVFIPSELGGIDYYFSCCATQIDPLSRESQLSLLSALGPAMVVRYLSRHVRIELHMRGGSCVA